MTRLRKLDVIRVVRLEQPARSFDGTESVRREPQIGDIGTIVHDYSPEDPQAAVAVESLDADGLTVWLADFAKSEIELVRSYSDAE